MEEGPKLTPLEALAAHVRSVLGEKIDHYAIAYGELTFETHSESILEVIQFLRDDVECRFISIVDICGVDYPEREQRFEVVYHLLSPTRNLRVRLKVPADDVIPVPSLTALFPGADWYEREAYDLYGILFSGHPDLRRLLTDYGFDGYPMRKDFPTTGYVEVRYDEERKRVVYEPVKLQQEFRTFDYLSPWEGTDYVLPGDEKKS
jgi:NADH-quinone oxidoreductase subunit C